MWAIRVRAWVEVVGSVMELFHFRVQWNARNISRATLCECGEASSFQEANPMYEETDHSCLPAHSCQEANPMYEEIDDSLSEGEFESSWPCSIQKYCRVQRNWEFVPVQWGRWGRLTMKRCGRGGPAGSVKANEVWINLLEIPLHWAGERKTPWDKPGERYKHQWKSGSVALRPVENSAPLPLMAHSTRILDVPLPVANGRLNPVLCLARHTACWANEPRGLS